MCDSGVAGMGDGAAGGFISAGVVVAVCELVAGVTLVAEMRGACAGVVT